MVTQIKGLILGDIVWGEHDKLLSILTAEHGKVSVVLKGGSSLKSKIVGSCLPFAYAELTLGERNGSKPWVKEASEIRGFHGIREDLEETAVALYILDILNEVCLEDEESGEMLQLALNTLHAIETKMKPLLQLKAAFELRTAAACGFSPDLVTCVECGDDQSEMMFLDVMDGVMTCRKCRDSHMGEAPEEGHTSIVLMLNKPMLDTMRLICYSPPKKFLTFILPQEDEALFCSHCEKYLLNHLDKGFKSLDFFHSLAGI